MELTGTTWRLVGFETDSGPLPAAEAPATLEFPTQAEAGAGRLGGSGGCNRYVAIYTLAGDRLSIGPLGSTRMMCGPERMAQEDRFFRALQLAERCELRDGELLIAYAGGELRFARAGGPAAGDARP